MSKKDGLPDAWDDDYEALVDTKSAGLDTDKSTPPVKISRAERKAQHAEANRQLWESAENPETPYFVQARDNVPLKSEFKPAVRVLSRKPKPVAAKPAPDLAKAVGGVSLGNEEDDSEEEERKAQAKALSERQERARMEREEKQRRYEEVRERLFGSSNASESSSRGRASPSRGSSNGRARAQRGGRRGGRDSREGSQPASSADESPVRGPSQTHQLYDPDYAPNPTSSYLQKSEGMTASAPSTSQPIRNPKGPDASGRGFKPRGNKSTAP